MTLKSYVSKVVDAISNFPDLSHIHITPSEGSVTLESVAKERAIFVRAVTPADSEVNTPMCLGNFKFLQRVLGLEQIEAESGTATAVLGKSLAGTDIVRYIDFAGPRFKVRYETTDPKAGNIEQVPNMKAINWATSIKLEPSHQKELAEAVSLFSIASPQKTEVKLSNRGGNLWFVLEIGERASNRDIEVDAGPIEGEFQDTYFNVKRLLQAIALSTQGEGAKLSIGTGLKVDFTLDGDEYMIAMPRNTAPSR